MICYLSCIKANVANSGQGMRRKVMLNFRGSMKRWIGQMGLLCLIHLTLCSLVFAEIDFSQYREVPCDMFISDAMDKDPEFLSALQIYLGTRYDKLSAKAISEWTLGAMGGIEHSEPSVWSSYEPDKTDSYFYEVSLEKLFLTTGTRFRVSHGNAMSEMAYSGYSVSVPVPYSVDPRSEELSVPDVTVSVVQPLVKNAFGLADRFPINVAELQVKAAELDVQEAWENRISELYNAYLTWVAAYENVVALQEIVADLKHMERQVKRKVDAKVSEWTDFLLTRDTVLNYQGQLIQAEGDFINASMNITSLRLGRPVTRKDIQKIKPRPGEIVLGPDPVIHSNDLPDVSQLRLVRQLKILGTQLKETIRVAKNDRLPSVDLVGDYTRKGNSEDKGGGYTQLEKDSRKDYALMLQFQYPLGSREARGTLGRAESDLTELEASIISTGQSLALALAQMAEDIRRLEHVRALLEERVVNAEEKLGLDMEKYRIGRLDTRYLIDSRNALTNARLQKVQTEIQIKQLHVEYLSISDGILKRFPDLMNRIKVK
jgi:outer membrane protein TolC